MANETIQDFMALDETTVRDYCGEVVEVGSNAGKLKLGDRIIGLGCVGVQTSFKTLATTVIKIPDDLGSEDAASMPLAYATAFYCLQELAGLKKNQSVLIMDADSAVGLAAIRTCQMIGADVSCLLTNVFDLKLKFLALLLCARHRASRLP